MPKTGRRPCRSPRPASVTRLRPIIRDTARKDKAARQAAADRKGTSRRVAIRVSTVAPLIDGFLGVPRARRSGLPSLNCLSTRTGSSPREAIREMQRLGDPFVHGEFPARGDQGAAFAGCDVHAGERPGAWRSGCPATAPVASTFLPISRDSSKHSPRYRRASGAAYDAARAYRGGAGRPRALCCRHSRGALMKGIA